MYQSPEAAFISTTAPLGMLASTLALPLAAARRRRVLPLLASVTLPHMPVSAPGV